MSFTIKIEPEALKDIQESIDWYNEQQPGVGHEFHSDVKATFKKIKSNPYFQVRYDNVRCFPMKKYPFMVHFTVDDKNKTVVVRAIFNTSRDPDIWEERK